MIVTIHYLFINSLLFGVQNISDIIQTMVYVFLVIRLNEISNKNKLHILVTILVANAILQSFCLTLKEYFDIDFGPLCKAHVDCTSDEIRNNTFVQEVLYTILFIFINGPLKIFLEIKEGKTSLKKMVEDYEDERNLLHEKLGFKRPDLLPTQSNNANTMSKRNVSNKDNDINELR
ncbi:UNKNOWN [Stylonychia lemnae]|uniref:Uncharacterized protein n=1 Tax=Stylonychia lemnae TaxID=5949 RepID=A0A077ZR90_STYLE|nr:UNKNOWN [Stylonychia lemnae]|eukprot:CDW71969.1 UNKNOWN [Stylonychia lemnae]